MPDGTGTPRQASKFGTLTKGPPNASIPSPEILAGFAKISPSLPEQVLKEWTRRHREAFIYATTSLVLGGLVALSLIVGFVYLVTQGHGGYAGLLLGAGALSMVAGFRASRL